MIRDTTLPRARTLRAPAGHSTLLALLATLVAGFLAAIAIWGPTSALAAEVSCPNANPIVNENNCMGEGTTANQSAIENYSEDLGGFTTQSGYELGENVR